MIEDEKEKKLNELGKDLLFYLKNYKELTQTRPRYKQVVDREIKEIIKLMKALSR